VLETFTAATFTPFVDTEFAARIGEEAGLTLRLLEASEADGEGAAATAGRRKPFALLFGGPLRPILPQRTYTLDHERLVSFELFIVPIGPEGGVMRYEAVFG
jgi:hypothetical protein